MDAPVTYIPDFVTGEFADRCFSELWRDLDWERREGVPRREYWFNVDGRDYTYGSGRGVRTYQSRDPHWVIAYGAVRLMEQDRPSGAPTHGYRLPPEGCFLNGYEDGSDYLGPHSDDDPNIDHSRPIAIVTLYEDPKRDPRTIQFREIIRPRTETDRGEFGPWETLALEHGSLALMAPGMQFTHQHQIPKAGFVASPRISLTYRGLS